MSYSYLNPQFATPFRAPADAPRGGGAVQNAEKTVDAPKSADRYERTSRPNADGLSGDVLSIFFSGFCIGIGALASFALAKMVQSVGATEVHAGMVALMGAAATGLVLRKMD
ncbi:MAG: hypothetical protein AAF654_13565 [Myxococcota bacterium]